MFNRKGAKEAQGSQMFLKIGSFVPPFRLTANRLDILLLVSCSNLKQETSNQLIFQADNRHPILAHEARLVCLRFLRQA